MTTVLNVNLDDLSSQFVHDLKRRFSKTVDVEIRLRDMGQQTEALFSDTDFWRVIDRIDWSQKTPQDQLLPATEALSKMSVMNIYLFADKLAQKLYELDTRAHGRAYTLSEGDDFLSVDDFLYVRCAAVAEGKEYYENVLKVPSKLSSEITFEPLLNLADNAYLWKTGRHFDYRPAFNYETYSNKEGWK